MNITTALFDMDGTLVDCEHIYTEFWDKVGEKFGHSEKLGSSIKGMIPPNIMAKHFPEVTEEDRREVYAKLAELDKTMPVVAIKGAPQFVEKLSCMGIKMAVVTSAPATKAKRAMRELGLDKYFGAFVGSEDVKIGKPNPTCYLMGAKKLGSSPEECIVFEDSPSGIRAGFAANMRVVALSTTISRDKIEELHASHYIIDGFEDMGKALKTLEK